MARTYPSLRLSMKLGLNDAAALAPSPQRGGITSQRIWLRPWVTSSSFSVCRPAAADPTPTVLGAPTPPETCSHPSGWSSSVRAPPPSTPQKWVLLHGAACLPHRASRDRRPRGSGNLHLRLAPHRGVGGKLQLVIRRLPQLGELGSLLARVTLRQTSWGPELQNLSLQKFRVVSSVFALIFQLHPLGCDTTQIICRPRSWSTGPPLLYLRGTLAKMSLPPPSCVRWRRRR